MWEVLLTLCKRISLSLIHMPWNATAVGQRERFAPERLCHRERLSIFGLITQLCCWCPIVLSIFLGLAQQFQSIKTNWLLVGLELVLCWMALKSSHQKWQAWDAPPDGFSLKRAVSCSRELLKRHKGCICWTPSLSPLLMSKAVQVISQLSPKGEESNHSFPDLAPPLSRPSSA